MFNIIDVTYKWISPLKTRTQTKFIVLHHADSEHCTVQDIDKWHKQNGWDGIGYHFFINKAGEVYRCRPVASVGAHILNYNEISVGICFEGNFEVEEMGDIQIASGIELIRLLRKEYKCSVVRHKDLMSSLCPGKNFPDKIIFEGMTDIPEEHWAEKIYKELIDRGLDIKEKRFDDNITRGESFALMLLLLKNVLGINKV